MSVMTNASFRQKRAWPRKIYCETDRSLGWVESERGKGSVFHFHPADRHKFVWMQSLSSALRPRCGESNISEICPR
jgi:hypothetical protein